MRVALNTEYQTEWKSAYNTILRVAGSTEYQTDSGMQHRIPDHMGVTMSTEYQIESCVQHRIPD